MRLGDLVIDVTPLRTSRDFRFLFAARLVSLLGLGLTLVALPLQVWQLTHSSWHVGLVSVVNMVPMLIGTLAGGILADRMDRRKLILLARGSAVVVFAVLALNAAADTPYLWVIYLSAAVNSVLNGLSATALMATTPNLVGRDQLPAAGALMAITAELGAIIGPSVAGGLTELAGLSWNYGLTAVATFITTALIAFIRPQPPAGAEPDESPLRSIAGGLRFVAANRLIAGLLLIDMVVVVFAMPTAIFPELTERMYGDGGTVLGLFYAAPGVGAMIAALASGWTGTVKHTGRHLIWATAACGLAVAGLGLTADWLWVSLFFLALLGAADTISEILRRSLLQHNTPDHLQGRVSSLWLAQTNVGPAIGSVEVALAARLAGPATALIAGGILCAAGAVAVGASSRELRDASLHDPSADDLLDAAAPTSGN
ncbi:MFS transporter [Actinoplanes lobatus]|uniref:ENTS family enterobactin (Siderophore) exporter n=1 Tax=Actinoplanes lobatus TaxID=113568 RepID=A0A7W7HN26_9ACTN|nr:enterobactin transporter EntS [Actinoplanes lobatus]MBB4753549.1 ENTS family enterobactin (siderophore) exporter [Actinoplanes lobatus]GGN84864.1 MFS transporter [Actinoplanes lobatus]GIE38085.1 MFS transporter [Actinoplanes lobatus]